MLEHECQELDLLMAAEDEEAEHTEFQQELATMLKHAQKLEGEADEQVELAEQHQTVHDYFSATAEPSEGNELDPIDLQLAELRAVVKNHLKSAEDKVGFMNMTLLCSIT